MVVIEAHRLWEVTLPEVVRDLLPRSGFVGGLRGPRQAKRIVEGWPMQVECRLLQIRVDPCG